MGIAMVAKRDFDSMTCVWDYIVRTSLKRDLPLKNQSFLFLRDQSLTIGGTGQRIMSWGMKT